MDRHHLQPDDLAAQLVDDLNDDLL